MCQQAEGIGIAVEVDKVCPLGFSHLTAIFKPWTFKEICSYGSFARMAERRIAHVVSQTGGTDNGAELSKLTIVQFWPKLPKGMAYIIAQAAPHTCHLQ